VVVQKRRAESLQPKDGPVQEDPDNRLGSGVAVQLAQ
jgi:hypothetical protein